MYAKKIFNQYKSGKKYSDNVLYNVNRPLVYTLLLLLLFYCIYVLSTRFDQNANKTNIKSASYLRDGVSSV